MSPDIPRVIEASDKRHVSLEDIGRLRTIDSLSISPDGRSYALFVHQGDVHRNSFRTGVFVGNLNGGILRRLAQGGTIGLQTRETGDQGGEIAGRRTSWSRDSRWIVYARQCEGEVQLWRVASDGSRLEQITHNPGDVREFVWSETTDAIYYSVGAAREDLRRAAAESAARGYKLNDELYSFADVMKPSLPMELHASERIWCVSLARHYERPAGPTEEAEFRRLRAAADGGFVTLAGQLSDDAAPPISNGLGELAWATRLARFSPEVRLMARRRGNTETKECSDPACSGAIVRFWWSGDGSQVLFWKNEGINYRGSGIYAWNVDTGHVVSILQAPDDYVTLCELAKADRIICSRETKTRPVHLISVRVSSGELAVLADVNPEFVNIQLGRVDRFEWATPQYDWNSESGPLRGVYPPRAYGYIMYPPDFDPRKTYPAFLDPYSVVGFEPSVGAEHSLHVYAASGFIVINTGLPMPSREAELLGAQALRLEYSEALGFPHLTMTSESTLRALQIAIGKGNIDPKRIGTGGVSHGSFVPMFLMQKHPDIIAAISVSTPNWSFLDYYYSSRKGRGLGRLTRGKAGLDDWQPSPDTVEGRRFWSAIDIADHLSSIRAPMLFNLAAFESFGAVRLMRRLDDAGKPYDAYIFADETHLKWQPAHLHAALTRNLDWFRFWLQGYQDPDPAKEWQYEHWNLLKARMIQTIRRKTSSGSP